MGTAATQFGDHSFDYHGALVVIETGAGEIVFIHPPGGPADAPASLPSNPCDPGEAPETAAVRMSRELTGLDVEVVREFVTFIQEGTPTGTMCAHGYVATVTGGALTGDGPEGPARAYPPGALPAIMPIRVANQRALAAYLGQRDPADASLAARPARHNGPMELAGRLQIKPGTLVAIVAAPPDGPDLAGDGALQVTASPDEAGAVIAFARHQADLAGAASPAIEAARQDKLTWIAYPKAGQLGTDLNRDILASAVAELGVRPVRQIAIDEVWSALRFRPAQ